ncbi:HAD family hydrolase [Jeongeupia chitinilytica]|uniref:Phosphoglycolate phosphatase n=1 Tax=Jeongeupia chitinilytica TaxID=1041641 RepID=A0ABQ3GXY5_9NEIS|nr:HAD-IA family hydrolase [Jeongeupia chitinilytica]GHD57877.1 phosphoglycolate phosphatase [Jeongeupia chitinilytica]
MIRAILFDLDGTLADTAPDLGAALNRLLVEEGRPEQPYEAIRPLASHGARGLIGLGFGVGPDDASFSALRERFLAHYATALCERTVLFDGVAELIAAIGARGLPWGIVTNKPGRFTDPLVRELPLPVQPGCVVSGDTVGVAKPDPKPMLHAAEQLGVPAASCLYVGDAERDIEAGRRVGMKTVIADYGYISVDDQPIAWGADLRIAHPLDLLAHLPD